VTSVPTSISVVIPLYNGSAFIRDALDSLMRQSEPLNEVIVVDDGSSDEGTEIVAGHPLEPRLLSRPNSGVAGARNIGAAYARGEYVTFLDQDDMWLPTRHARLRAHLAANPQHDVVITKATEVVATEDLPELRRINARWHEDRARVASKAELAAWAQAKGTESGPPEVVGAYSIGQLLSGPPSLTTTFVARRDVYLTAGGCMPLAPSFDDYMCVLALSRLTTIWLIDEPSVLYRVHPGNTTFQTDWPVPMLVGFCLAKLGGSLSAAGADMATRRALAPTVDLRLSWMDKLFQLADTGSAADLADALALIRLTASGAGDRRRASALVLRRHLKRRWMRMANQHGDRR
jgi:hypothetical protein